LREEPTHHSQAARPVGVADQRLAAVLEGGPAGKARVPKEQNYDLGRHGWLGVHEARASTIGNISATPRLSLGYLSPEWLRLVLGSPRD